MYKNLHINSFNAFSHFIFYFFYNKSFSHAFECTRLPTHLGNKGPRDSQLKIHDEQHNFFFFSKLFFFFAITASQSEMCFYMYNSAYTYLQVFFFPTSCASCALTNFISFIKKKKKSRINENMMKLCKNVGPVLRMKKSLAKMHNEYKTQSSANIVFLMKSIMTLSDS